MLVCGTGIRDISEIEEVGIQKVLSVWVTSHIELFTKSFNYIFS
ncbi:hypothetical protein EZS27_027579 [termite gut metagenome]|uniref:Uncharacterized protein n=1 Tax=termite gut metagenome TaxID=433724 RepID=A0A5J4QPF9_9ZZZZ